jgi:hypothetical protein
MELNLARDSTYPEGLTTTMFQLRETVPMSSLVVRSSREACG